MNDEAFPQVVTEFQATPHDDEAVDKVLAFWEACSNAGDSGLVSVMWQRIFKDYHSKLIQMLNAADRKALRASLGQFWNEPYTHGFAAGSDKMKQSPGTGGGMIRNIAEGVGAIPYRSEGPSGLTRRDLVKRIEEFSGVALGIPMELSGGMLGHLINDRPVGAKDLQSFMFAYSSSLLRDGANICEIGPGLGHSAYYHHQFGAENVYLFDLPNVAVVSIWFLVRLEGADKVFIYGEQPKETHRYFIYPNFRFGDESTEIIKFETLTNKNSFPEMGEEIAASYFKKSEFYGCNKIFSTNHEKIIPVSQCARRAGWRCLSRSRNWLRPEHLDEIFVPDSLSTARAR